jgi:hypothetical protein
VLWKGTNIRVYRDNVCDLAINEIIDNLSRRFTGLNFIEGASNFVLTDSTSCTLMNHKELEHAIDRETAGDDIVFLFTEKPYSSNLFWQIFGRKVIISFFGWDYLTQLPRNNGAVYFICSMILFDMLGERQQHNSSCMMDYWWYYSGINEGLKSSWICPACLDKLHKLANAQQQKILSEIVPVLRDLRAASRGNMDICSYWKIRNRTEQSQAFLYHSIHDRDGMKKMGDYFKKNNMETFPGGEQFPLADDSRRTTG